MTSSTFRFDAESHEYLDPSSGEVFEHITGLLTKSGLVDDTWFTEESSERGRQVHRLTADYDYGAIEDPSSVRSLYKGYFLAHVKAVQIVRPEFHGIEEPMVHPVLRFAGRPDRYGIVYGLKAVWEVKAAIPAKSHRVQTALQAILVSLKMDLPPERIARFCCYLKKNGAFSLEEHVDRRDFDRANGIIKEFVKAA